MKIYRFKLCECGCGGSVRLLTHRFIHGHQSTKRDSWKPKSPPQICACGICGLMTKPGARFIQGHHRKGSGKQKPLPKLCECGRCNKMASPGKRVVHGHQTEKQRREHSIKMSGEGNPNFGKRGQNAPAYGHHKSEELRKQISIRMSGDKNPMHGRNVAYKKGSKEAKRYGKSGPGNNWYGKCGELNHKFGKKNSKESNAKTSIGVKKSWENHTEEERNSRIRKSCPGRQCKPNKTEIVLLNILDKLYPKEWEFTGGFSFLINGRSPDFTNKTSKKLIELFGDYWHRGQNPQDRTDLFKPFGWDCLVIWEKELKDFKKLRRKIFDFAENKNGKEE